MRYLTPRQEMWWERYLGEFIDDKVVSAKARDIYHRYAQYKGADGKWTREIPELFKRTVDIIEDRAVRAMTDGDHEEFNRLGERDPDDFNELEENPKDYCYRKVKRQYRVFPSAYASGAIVQCRRRLGMNPRFALEKKYGLHGWFMRGGGKGWVDCKTGKPCGRGTGERRAYPACRPTLSMCTTAMKKKRGRKRISWLRKNPVPPQSVARIACRGLAKRKKYRRGGTSVGVARARDLCNRRNLSKATLARMRSYFARHRGAKAENAKRKSDPTSAAAIADDLWGGTAGMRWAKHLVR